MPSGRGMLLDIEGTTTPLSFVHDVLFPYARLRVEPFIREHWPTPALRDIVAGLATEHAADSTAVDRPPAWLASTDEETIGAAVAYCRWLIDRDGKPGARKSPALKQLQGLIWDRGYDEGELHGIVFPDVPTAFRRWRDEGRTIAIYSSGSELAQRRLFATTDYGDLTPFIARFFDTAVGAKIDAASYSRIASALELPPRGICFISDIARELAAARGAGCDVRLAVRPGNPPHEGAEMVERIHTFDQL